MNKDKIKARIEEIWQQWARIPTDNSLKEILREKMLLEELQTLSTLLKYSN